MKKLLTILYIVGIFILSIVLPNMIANGVDVPIGAISIVGSVLFVLTLIVFSGGNNNGE